MHSLGDWVGDAGVKSGKPDLKVRPEHFREQKCRRKD